MSKKFFRSILNLNRKIRRLILISFDISIILIAIFLVNRKINLNTFSFDNIFFYYLLCISFGITIYLLTGQYKGITRFQGSNFFYKLIIRNFIISLFSSASYYIFFKDAWGLNYLFEFFITISSLSFLIRFLLKDILNRLYNFPSKKISYVAIYGAGNAGAQLEFSLRLSKEYEVVCFFDDNRNLRNRFLNNKPIFSPEKLEDLKYKIDRVLLAIPSLNNYSKKKIINFLANHQVSTYIVPSIEELSSGSLSINSLRPIRIEDILGRDSVPPNDELLRKEIENRVVCIIGAAGSIGGQLSKEISCLKPKKVICLDQSELGLYELEQSLYVINRDMIDIEYLLLNAQNQKSLEYIFEKYKVDLIFHAAAYKHVPLVENNSISGILNNVWTSLSICKAALNTKVKKIMLISTDKAVRPSNVMGASKRLSELVFQAYAAHISKKEKIINNEKPVFSMVRFGNVLNSSGSVVPLFKKQISKGGPITLTDKKITRYFMTILEAAQLVIQAISLAEGGEVFLLDMAKPIKIYDLAKQMIILSGLKIKDKNNPYGDIEIIQTGLRPGEKLFEELLIDAKSEKTTHNLIYKAREKYIELELLLPELELLYKHIDMNNHDKAMNQLAKLVPEWERKS